MRVYIVDRSVIVRSKLALLFAEIEGLELAGQAGSVKDATKDILMLQPDVALVDIKLFDGNGLDVLKSIQVQGLKTKTMVMTFDPHPQYRKRATELGASHFIDKAREFESIRLILGQMVAEQRVTLKAV